MKKNILKIVLLIFIAFTGISCNDSFLERDPTTDIQDKEGYYWNTLAELEVFNNSIYEEAGNNGRYMFMLGFTHDAWSSNTHSVYFNEVLSDNFVSKSGNHQWAARRAAGKMTVPAEIGRGDWYWHLLRHCNILLANYDQVTAKQEDKNQYAGEALLFRAWFYLDKVQQFGDVPYIDVPLTVDSITYLYGPRNDRKYVMDKVLEDISLACEYLPVTWSGNKTGRVDKGTALALKSRICLYEGTYRKYHNLGDHEKFLREAVSASRELIKLGKYSLYDTGNPNSDYASLFNADELEGNPEMIFYRRYKRGLLGHRLCGYIVQSGTGATKSFVDDFLYLENGEAKPISLASGFNNDSLTNEIKNRDPRLTQIILDPAQAEDLLFNRKGFYFPRFIGMQNWESATGYYVIKYYSAEQDAKGYGNEEHDAPLFRYSEVLLNLAEALEELGELTQNDLNETVNLIRKRAGMPDMKIDPVMDPVYANEGISSNLVEIRRERRIELCFEQLRYQDLMRWKKGEKLAEKVLGARFEPEYFDLPEFKNINKSQFSIYKHTDGKNYVEPYYGTEWNERVFDPKKHYLAPIPLIVLAGNNKIEQNEGWR